jgi:uncharacterized protein YndB with AHSA1/START domain
LEKIYETSATDLWSALSEPERIERWFAPVDGDFRVGGDYRINFDVESDTRCAGRILECEAPRHLLITWNMRDEGESSVRVDLEDLGETTRLVLEHQKMPVEEAVNYGAGWHTFLEQLGADLAGREGHGAEFDGRWEQLRPSYESQMS